VRDDDKTTAQLVREIGALRERLSILENAEAERKATEEKLRKANASWEEMFQAVGRPTLIIDPEYRIRAANRASVELIGKPMNEIIGAFCHEIMHNSSEPPENCPFKRILAGPPRPIELEQSALGRDYLISCTPVLDESGNVKSTIHIATDITEIKRAKEENERLVAELRDALASVQALSGLLPICAVCKKIRDDTGYWQQLERYIKDHSEADFTHGLCPECAEELLDENGVRDEDERDE